MDVIVVIVVEYVKDLKGMILGLDDLFAQGEDLFLTDNAVVSVDLAG